MNDNKIDNDEYKKNKKNKLSIFLEKKTIKTV